MELPMVPGPAEGRAYWGWGDRYDFKVMAQDSAGAHALLEMSVAPGSATPPHTHHAEDELFYVLDGTLSLWSDDRRIEGTPGTFVAIPKGTLYRWGSHDGPGGPPVIPEGGSFEIAYLPNASGVRW